MIKQQLSQKQQQKLSPLQIQQIKMLELNTLELENRVNQELEENPALEEGGEDTPETEELHEENFDSNEREAAEDLSLGDYLREEDIPDFRFNTNTKENSREDIPFSEGESFQEYMLDQLRLRNLSKDEFRIGSYIIGNIDEDGYLRRNLVSISDDLAFRYGMEVPVAEIKKISDVIKELDPPGIAASDLQECLLLQLKRKEWTENRKRAIDILTNYFNEFSKKHYDKIKKALNIDEPELKDALKEIMTLPKPGNTWESNLQSKMSQVIPDFIVEVVAGEPIVSMADQHLPELKVSREYVDMFNDYSKNKSNQSKEKKETLFFVKQKLDAAKWFIDAVKQRQNTLLDTMKAIVHIQRDFFISGEEVDLKPMILKDVASLSGYDISTISRVSNSKYVQTDFGVYSLKYFFSESLYNESGEEVSTKEVKAILKECIEREDKHKPLTDDALVKELKEKGYAVARRTIAKYREQLGIPVARLRKEI